MFNIKFRNALSCSLILVAGLSVSLTAQTPVPSPSPSSATGGLDITSTVEIGVRGLSVNGDHEKYRSDLNYRAGIRLFDSSFFVEDNTSGLKLFDSALLQTSGWGSDPQGMFRLNMDKTGIYKFDSNVRRVRYFNNLKSHATTWSEPVSTGSQHRMNTLHHFGDFDLTIFPERDFRLRFGYSFNDTEGPGSNNIRFSSDEYMVNSTVKGRSQDFRAGVEGKLFGFNLGVNYGHRLFKDGTRYYVDTLNLGNNPASNTSIINLMTRQFNVEGTTDFVNFFIQRNFWDRLDFTGRLVHAVSRSEINESDFINGRSNATATGNFILDTIAIPGTAKRPQTRGDVGFTLRATRDFRISNTFSFDQYNVGGSNNLFEVVQTTTSGGTTTTTTTNSYSWRLTAYRRFSNLIEADYQFNRAFAINAGYRYTKREVTVSLFDRNLLTGAVQRSGSEDHENSTHSFIVGSRIKPTPNWSIYVDLERGESDNVFTRLANNDYFNFRARSVASVNNFMFNLSFITRDSDNPGTSAPITSSGGFPATETIADSRIRIFAGSVDWTPRTDLSLSAGYTYTFQTTTTDVIVPVGVPIFTSTRFLLGSSEYYVRDSYFHFDVSAKPVKWFSMFASYRIDDDRGQGDRVITRPQDMIYSYPIRNHMPEVKLAFRLTRNIDWNVGYQYYSYRERQYLNPFGSRVNTGTVVVPQIVPAQNYSAHMPYTSLKIYFGRAAEDR